MFNFDEFISKSALQILGEIATIIPANNKFQPFKVKGDFHEDYKEINPDSSSSSITSSVIAIFIRDVDLPNYYSKINQGDSIRINSKLYQIIDIQIHIPGSKKLILHESP